MIERNHDFERIARYFLSPNKTFATSFEGTIDFAIGNASVSERAGAIAFLESVLARNPSGAELKEMWSRQERMYPRTAADALMFTTTVLDRLKDKSILSPGDPR